MKIYQVVLRYQKKGLLNEKVFRSVSSATTPAEDIAELEEIFDIIKGNDEINEDDIVNVYEEYAFFKLKSGRYCLNKIILADEYKERYLCHSLILDEGCFPFYPSEAINSPVFLNESSNIDDFKPAILDNIPLSGEFAFRSVSEHIKTQGFRPIREILKAIVDHGTESQNIVIIDKSKSMYLTIASLQIAFPSVNAHTITFSTVKLNTENRKVMLNCFYEPQDIPDGLINSSWIYNLRTGMFPQNFSNYKFIRVAETGYVVSGQVLTAFHKYLSQFDYKEIDKRLEDAYNLFVMLNSESEMFSVIEVKRIFEFALQSSGQDMLEYLFEKLEPSIVRIVKMADFEGILLIVEFLHKAALNNDKPILMQIADKSLLNIVDHISMDRKELNIEKANELYDFLRERIKDNPHVFLRCCITQERISYINTLLSHDPGGEKALFHLGIVVKALVELGYTWPQVLAIDNAVVFFDTCMTQIASSGLDAAGLLKTASQNVDIFSHFIILLFNRIQSEDKIKDFAAVFSEILDGIEPDIMTEIRKRVNNLGGGKLLFEEYKIRVERNILSQDDGKSLMTENFNSAEITSPVNSLSLEGQPEDESKPGSIQEGLINFFNEYFKSVFSIIHDYYKNYFSEALKIYISKLEGDYKYNECIRLIYELSSNGIIIDDEAAAFLVKGFEEGVRIYDIDKELEKIFSEVKKLKKTRNITSYPDITAMVDFVMWLKQNTNSEYTIDEILNERLDIDKLDAGRKHKYLEWCLPEVLGFVRTAEDHKKIIHYFQREEDEKFFDEYLDIIIELIDKNKEKGIRVLRGFVVYFFFYLEPSYRLLGEEAVITKVRQSIIDIFNNNPKSFLKEFDYQIKKEFSDRGLSMPIQWSQIVNDIGTAPQSSFFDKISKIFKK